MYLFYFDESGNAHMSARSLAVYPWFALGAVGIPDRRWRTVDSALTRLKECYFPTVPAREIEIRSTVLRSWGTPRAHWPWTLLNASQIHALVEEFYALYDDHDLSLFFAVLDKVAHSRTSPNPAHPYEVTFETLLRSINRFLVKRDEIGLCFLDEFKGMDRQVISRYTWRRRAGGAYAREIARIVEPPAFVVSRDSQMIALADVAIYNVYRRFRENDPAYPYFVRIQSRIVDLITLPNKKSP